MTRLSLLQSFDNSEALAFEQTRILSGVPASRDLSFCETTQPFAVIFGHSVAQTLARIRHLAPALEHTRRFVVVDTENRRVGSISLERLLLSSPKARIADIMDTASDFNTVASHATLSGEPQSERFSNVSGYLQTSMWQHFKTRIFWIIGLASLDLVSGLIIHSYESALSNLLILALYMPMIADTGGNTGSQTATVVIRALALEEISFRDTLRVLFKEFRISLLIALILALLAIGKVLFLSGGEILPPELSLARIGSAIGLALGLQVICSNFVGALLPLATARCRLDPAVIASPVLTTIVDILGLLIYFGTARALLGIS